MACIGHELLRRSSPTPPAKAVRDYNGSGPWSAEQIRSRYQVYCRSHHLAAHTGLDPVTHEDPSAVWIYPAMDKVILGIEAGDAAGVELGVDFVQEDQGFPFGALLKAKTARALRRAHTRGELSPTQRERLRTRIVKMLIAGNTPHEFREYAELVRHLGLDAARLTTVMESAELARTRSARRYFTYFAKHVR